MSEIRHALIVDDLAATRDWLRQALNLAFSEVRIVEAETLAQARTLARTTPPDLALVDLRLPDGHGTVLIRELRQTRPRTLSIVPTIFDDDGYLFGALCAGAAGYLLKDHALPRLAQAVRAIVEGQPPLSPPLSRRLLQLATQQRLSLDTSQRALLQLRARGATAAEAAAGAGLEPAAASAALRAVYARLSELDDSV